MFYKLYRADGPVPSFAVLQGRPDPPRFSPDLPFQPIFTAQPLFQLPLYFPSRQFLLCLLIDIVGPDIFADARA